MTSSNAAVDTKIGEKLAEKRRAALVRGLESLLPGPATSGACPSAEWAEGWASPCRIAVRCRCRDSRNAR